MKVGGRKKEFIRFADEGGSPTGTTRLFLVLGLGATRLFLVLGSSFFVWLLTRIKARSAFFPL